jgi:hypothetical protein
MKDTKSATTKTDPKLIRFNILINELFPQNKAEAKEGILSGYGVTSSKELTQEQLVQAIEGLEKEKEKRKAPIDKPIQVKRSQCLTLLTKIGIDTTSWPKINEYLKQPRLLNGKRMYDLDLEGLEALRKKLYNILNVVEQRIQNENHWASNN